MNRRPRRYSARPSYSRFYSRGEEDFADRLLSAMRFQFGGHVERGAGGKRSERRQPSAAPQQQPMPDARANPATVASW